MGVDRVLCNRECVTVCDGGGDDGNGPTVAKQWRPRSPDRRRRGVLRMSQRIGLCGGGSVVWGLFERELNEGSSTKG
jgi:hypothetical protein